MSIPILDRTEQLAPDLLDGDEWRVSSGDTSLVELSVPPVPSPWAFSAFENALYFRPGANVTVEAELADALNPGEPFKLLVWVYIKAAPEEAPFWAQVGESSGGFSTNLSASRFHSGWNLFRWNSSREVGPISHIRVRRNGAFGARMWVSRLTLLRQADATPVLSRMIQAQADAGRVI